MHSMASNHKETMGQFVSINMRHGEHDGANALLWLSNIAYLQNYKKADSEVLQGTGTWMLEDSRYNTRRDCDERAMLWIHGILGSGKGKLVQLSGCAAAMSCQLVRVWINFANSADTLHLRSIRIQEELDVGW